ncbi:MAG: UxaA family hydrolase [Oscillibacter sp.]|nr:UxaA family hydrolase [Oscillibacter sp.]
MNFYGYKRPDGRVGIRNKVLILPASVCASDTTRIVAQQVVGSVTFNNQLGCSQVASDQQFTMDVMAGYAANPNVYGTVVISLGCENCQMDLVVEAIKARTNKPLKQVIIQEAGGTLKAIDQAVRYAKEMVAEASMLQKEEFPMSELIIGTECGGSDPTSGLASNPLIGQLSDLIVAEGGTSILSETTEFIGAEHILARRAATPEVHDRIFEIVHRYEKALQLVGEEVREGNPSPGNKAGGLTCLEEKSLGCIHKGGHSPVNAVYDYAKQVKAKQGLVIMDTPGNDPSSVAGMVAGGAQIVVFSTGRGTPTGNPLAPVIKITGNRITFANMEDNIDVDASPIIYGTKTLEQMGEELLKLTQEVASGKQTKAESLGYTEMAIARVCNFV